TRISGQDNIFKGWSTFTVEMLELRNILQRCDQRSLVLGDELCAGTESVSALAIVTAGIEMLSKKKTGFVFATHLHDLSGMKRVQSCSNVHIHHMHVEVDAQTGRIMYDRQLRPGPGSALYGLEVCRGLGLPGEFLRIAQSVRKELEGFSNTIVGAHTSRYNQKVRVHECKICGKPASETHHIEEQHKADDNGWIAELSHHKNRGFNLVPLCDGCHSDIHSGRRIVKGYKSTSEGVILDTCETTRKQKDFPSPQTHDQNASKEKLWPHVRYHTQWYLRKTSRSKWSVCSESDMISYLEKHNMVATKEALSLYEHLLFDPSF
ncbi:hypothetical protein EBT25_18205, partial [bacterium]|nr:hypothetical protein [bacterium]